MTTVARLARSRHRIDPSSEAAPDAAADAAPPRHIGIIYRTTSSGYIFESPELPGLFVVHQTFEIGRTTAYMLATELFRRAFGDGWQIQFRTVGTPDKAERRMLASA